MQMARKTAEQATATLKSLRKDFSKRISDPIDGVQKTSQDVDALNACRWVMEANSLNRSTKKQVKLPSAQSYRENPQSCYNSSSSISVVSEGELREFMASMSRLSSHTDFSVAKQSVSNTLRQDSL